MATGNRNLVLIFGAILFLGLAFALASKGHNEAQVVKITAGMFEYNPSRIALKKGQPVTVELTSLDRPHGFSIPELGLRADLLAEESVRIELLPEKAGSYTFYCDIFCGDGHEEMNGVIVVKE